MTAPTSLNMEELAKLIQYNLLKNHFRLVTFIQVKTMLELRRF